MTWISKMIKENKIGMLGFQTVFIKINLCECTTYLNEDFKVSECGMGKSGWIS